ncbi:hypothetical protein G9A89_000682 [Geosiphon pyriformis]|nr:hypothetical protein G9A89_000682 [Geosiphon pyriformis]
MRTPTNIGTPTTPTFTIRGILKGRYSIRGLEKDTNEDPKQAPLMTQWDLVTPKCTPKARIWGHLIWGGKWGHLRVGGERFPMGAFESGVKALGICKEMGEHWSWGAKPRPVGEAIQYHGGANTGWDRKGAEGGLTRPRSRVSSIEEITIKSNPYMCSSVSEAVSYSMHGQGEVEQWEGGKAFPQHRTYIIIPMQEEEPYSKPESNEESKLIKKQVQRITHSRECTKFEIRSENLVRSPTCVKHRKGALKQAAARLGAPNYETNRPAYTRELSAQAISEPLRPVKAASHAKVTDSEGRRRVNRLQSRRYTNGGRKLAEGKYAKATTFRYQRLGGEIPNPKHYQSNKESKDHKDRSRDRAESMRIIRASLNQGAEWGGGGVKPIDQREKGIGGKVRSKVNGRYKVPNSLPQLEGSQSKVIEAPHPAMHESGTDGSKLGSEQAGRGGGGEPSTTKPPPKPTATTDPSQSSPSSPRAKQHLAIDAGRSHRGSVKSGRWGLGYWGKGANLLAIEIPREARSQIQTNQGKSSKKAVKSERVIESANSVNQIGIDGLKLGSRQARGGRRTKYKAPPPSRAGGETTSHSRSKRIPNLRLRCCAGDQHSESRKQSNPRVGEPSTTQVHPAVRATTLKRASLEGKGALLVNLEIPKEARVNRANKGTKECVPNLRLKGGGGNEDDTNGPEGEGGGHSHSKIHQMCKEDPKFAKGLRTCKGGGEEEGSQVVKITKCSTQTYLERDPHTKLTPPCQIPVQISNHQGNLPSKLTSEEPPPPPILPNHQTQTTVHQAHVPTLQIGGPQVLPPRDTHPRQGGHHTSISTTPSIKAGT